MNHLRSAGAVVVSTDLDEPRTLLLDQIRHDGERQTVAPKGRIEPGESPLAAARREVVEETGITELLYAGYLGQESYNYTGRDGTPGHKTVDWFLFATDATDVAPRADEGFHQARWIPLDVADNEATHTSFHSYLDEAADILAWRQPLGISRNLSDLIGAIGQAASGILAHEPAAAVALCGSAARGDFVDGWSDVDLVGSNITDPSILDQLKELAQQVGDAHGTHCSLRFTDVTGHDASGPGPLYDMKLRAVLARAGIDVPVIAGTGQLPTLEGAPAENVLALIQACHDSAVQRLASPPKSQVERVDRVRRVLSALANAARRFVTLVSPESPLRLPAVVDTLSRELPSAHASALLAAYEEFRHNGADSDLTHLEAVAGQVPAALAELGAQVENHPTPA